MIHFISKKLFVALGQGKKVFGGKSWRGLSIHARLGKEKGSEQKIEAAAFSVVLKSIQDGLGCQKAAAAVESSSFSASFVGVSKKQKRSRRSHGKGFCA